jgi:uncharacterized protein YraI
MKAVRSVIAAGLATLALSAAPSIAQAAQGFVVDQTDLRAGPDGQFPSVDMLPAGAQVEVFGCLSGNIWCDIGFQQDRGWVSGEDLEILYQSQRVKVVQLQVEVVPVETFQVTTYWDEHYRNRPFFRDRDRYASININIENGGKAAPGRTGSGDHAAVTGSVNGRTETGRTETGSAAMKGKGEQSATAGCPASDRNCKTQGEGKGMTGKSANGGANANGMANGKAANDMNGKTATGGAGTREKTATSGSMSGERTGAVGAGAGQSMGGKGCKPGMAGCGSQGAGGMSAGHTGNAGEQQPSGQ